MSVLNEEIARLEATVRDLEAALTGPVLLTAPSIIELQTPRDRLAVGVRTGPVLVRKALMSALVESIDVHGPDDVRPTFRLFDAAISTQELLAAAQGGPSADDLPGQRDGFASQTLEWAPWGSNPQPAE